MADVLRIKKKNEVYVQIECDSGVAMELSEFFTFFVPGYQFMPSYKNKFWDGKIRLFNTRDHTLYGGLIPYIQEFAKVRECEIEFLDNDQYGRCDAWNPITRDQVAAFAESLNLYAHGKKITPRDYQIDAVTHAIERSRTLLLSPTASGKSLMIYLLIRWFLETHDNQKVLLVVPTTSLVEQMFTDFADYATIDESWDNETMCHRIYSGKEKMNIKSRVVITTWQSIYKMQGTWFEPYGMVIGDEAHNFKAKSLAAIMEKLRDAKYRIGTTGTLDGTQTHKLVLEGLFGPVHQVTTTKALIEQDALSDFDVSILLLKYGEEYCKAAKLLDYQQEIDFLVGYTPRNKFIRNLALAQGGNTLILYNYVEKHGKPLYDMIKAKMEEKGRTARRLFFVSGSVETDERERIRAITEKEKDAIIVASLGTFSTGINIRNLHNIIFASPSKSQIRILQSIGRGLRKADNGQKTKVFDVADDLHWKKSRNYTLDHAAERIKIYTKEQFKFQIYEVPIS
jgi:superfamily II DNA or RNA helicase